MGKEENKNCAHHATRCTSRLTLHGPLLGNNPLLEGPSLVWRRVCLGSAVRLTVLHAQHNWRYSSLAAANQRTSMMSYQLEQNFGKKKKSC